MRCPVFKDFIQAHAFTYFLPTSQDENQYSVCRFTTEKCEHSTLAIVNLLVTWAYIWASIAIFVPGQFTLICKTYHQYKLRIQCCILFTKKRKTCTLQLSWNRNSSSSHISSNLLPTNLVLLYWSSKKILMAFFILHLAQVCAGQARIFLFTLPVLSH